MIAPKSQNVENASAVHNAIMHVSEAYGRQLAALTSEIVQLRQELAVAHGRLAAQAKQTEPAPEPGSEL
jgi:hypothetical protein